MKKHLPLIGAALAASLSASAQMMPDSTVQIVAYWTKGDVVAYDCSSTEYSVDADGSKKDVTAQSETRVLEVLDEREDGYTLRLSYKDVFSPSSIPYLPDEYFKELCENFTITFTTDEYGTINGIQNSEEAVASLMKMLEKIGKNAYKGMDKEIRKEISEDKFIEYIQSMFANQDYLSSVLMSDVSPLLQYHGARLDTTGVYTYPQQFNLFGNASPVEIETKFRVNPAQTDSISVVINSAAQAGKDVLIPAIAKGSLKAIASGAAKMMDEAISEEELDKAVEELSAKILDLSLKEVSTLEIHLDTGWPLYWYYARQVVTRDEKSMTAKVIEKTVELNTEE